MNISKTFLSTILIFLSISSLSNTKAQQNTDQQQCADYHRKKTVTLRGEAIEKTPWYRDRRIAFDDWRDPNYYSFTIRENHHVQTLKDRNADIRYYANGIHYTVALEPTIEVPKYSEAEIIEKCP